MSITVEGFGASSLGGSGGTTLVVDTLSDTADSSATTASQLATTKGADGHISLREALTVSGPRIIQFSVSGNIALTSQLEVINPFFTIDGSTAPNGGIAITNAVAANNPAIAPVQLLVRTHDAIISHIRFRQKASSLADVTTNCLTVQYMEGTSPTDLSTFGIVIDHCSLSWSSDDGLVFWGVRDATVQWCIISEILDTGLSGSASRGFLMQSQTTNGSPIVVKNVSVHHNLFAHARQRTPAADCEAGDIRNNVIYDMWREGITCNPESSAAAESINFVGNYFKWNPVANGGETVSDADDFNLLNGSPGSTASTFYRSDNVSNRSGSPGTPQAATFMNIGGASPWTEVGSPISAALSSTPVTTTSAAQAYIDVLAGAGATMPRRDSVDSRIVTEVTNRTGSTPSAEGTPPDLTIATGRNPASGRGSQSGRTGSSGRVAATGRVIVS